MEEQSPYWLVDFTLTEEIDYDKTSDTEKFFASACEDEIEIKSSVGKKGQKSITGFTVKVENEEDRSIAEKVATRKAKKLTNLLVTISGTSSAPKLVGVSEKKLSGGYTTYKKLELAYSIKNNVDLNISKQKLHEILKNKNEALPRRMEHVRKAMDLINKEPAAAIRELVLACDDKPPGELEKYRFLRNALSHNTLKKETIKNIQRDFGQDYFEFTPEGILDPLSEKNIKNLTIEAKKFLNHVLCFLTPTNH